MHVGSIATPFLKKINSKIGKPTDRKKLKDIGFSKAPCGRETQPNQCRPWTTQQHAISMLILMPANGVTHGDVTMSQ